MSQNEMAMDFSELETTLHKMAMDFSEMAWISVHEGRPENLTKWLYIRAYECEKKSLSLMDEPIPEPTRSVMHRSIASLAMTCHRYEEAKEFIHRALEGNAPAEIQAELRDLLHGIEAATQ